MTADRESPLLDDARRNLHIAHIALHGGDPLLALEAMALASRSLAEIAARAARAGRRLRRCAYCGAPCRGLVCAAHRDLPRIDPGRPEWHRLPRP